MDAFPDPNRDAAGWHLALSTADGARRATAVVVAGRAMILLPRAGEGWWAVDQACAGCRARLPMDQTLDRVEQLVCGGCGRVHSALGHDTQGVPVMVVDDEIYVFCE